MFSRDPNTRRKAVERLYMAVARLSFYTRTEGYEDDEPTCQTAAWDVFAAFLDCLELPEEVISPEPAGPLFIPNLTPEGMAWTATRAATLATLRDLQRLAPEAKRQAFLKMLAASVKGARHG